MPRQALRSILPSAGSPPPGRTKYLSPAAPTRSCPPRSVSVRLARPPWLLPASRLPTCGNIAPAGVRASASMSARPPRHCAAASTWNSATADVSAGRNPIMGVYPARDGRWSYIHANFPNHRAAALKVLGCEETREAVTKAVAKWDARDLEEAIIAANGAGGMVRAMQEWADHPQAAAIAALPVLEIIRIGDSDPEPLPAANRPLSGIRVIDITRVLAGPTCARTLAEHGADVMKISAAASAEPRLSGVRHRPRQAVRPARSARATQCRYPARSGPRGGCVLPGYRPGTLGGRGLSPEELTAIRPGLVYVSLCAFGHTGPWASRRGFDTVVQSVSGITSRQAEVIPGRHPGPQFYPVSAIDYCTGYLMAFGAMVALKRRAEQGGSWLVRISLAQVGKWIVDLGEVPAAALTGVPQEFTAGELNRWSMVTETPSGRLRHLRPVVQLSETPPHWARPSVPLGYHPPVWPERGT